MITILVSIIVLIAVAIGSAHLCAPVYREEDKQRIYDRTFKIVSRGKPFIYFCWFVAAICSIIILVIHNNTGRVEVVCIVGMGLSLIFIMIGRYFRDSYYTADDKSLTYVSHKKVSWCIDWQDVAHVYRRVIHAGKTTHVVFDIVMKDGTAYKSLPTIIGRILKEHVPIEHYKINRIGIVLVVAFIILMLLLAFVLS